MKLKEPTIACLSRTDLSAWHQKVDDPGTRAVTPVRVLVYNRRVVGKSVTVASLLSPHMKGLVLSVHATGGGTGDYLVPAVNVTEADLPFLAALTAQVKDSVIVAIVTS